MYSGYLNKRVTPISPPSMQKVFCVLWGTLLFDYETEEDAKTSICPKTVIELLGVSEWDGKGRANNYPFGFLLVSHTGSTYYVSVGSLDERDEWIIHVKRALECVFANPEVAPFKPSKIIQNVPGLQSNLVCPRSHTTLSNSSSNGFNCYCCGRGFSAYEYVNEASTILQIGMESSQKVCLDCKLSQVCITWIKSLNYTHTMTLHEMSECVQRDISKFKSSFRLRRRLSTRLDMAAELFEAGTLSHEEFEELRNVDHAYRRELVYEDSLKLKSAVEAFHDDMQTIIGILMNPALYEQGGRLSFYFVIVRILEIADKEPELIDFYFPQLYQAHLLECRCRTSESLMKVDLLQQLLLVLSQKYPSLGLKLAWSLMATVSDYSDKKISQVQYAASVSLLLQLEMVVTGFVSAIADVPGSKLLAKVFRGAMHQQQEIGFEIGALFLVRRRLQELYDEEEMHRKNRSGSSKRYSESRSPLRHFDNDRSDEEEDDYNNNNNNNNNHINNNQYPSDSSTLSCLELFHQLGVGTARSSNPSNEDSSSDKEGSEDNNKNVNSNNNRSYPVNSEEFKWTGFTDQIDFLERVNILVDSLRFIDRPLRSETFCREIDKFNNTPTSLTAKVRTGKFLGWDPTTVAGEPLYRITRIVTEECRVFRTKARAPSLIVCEVVRDDLLSKRHFSHSHKRNVSNSSHDDVSSNIDNTNLQIELDPNNNINNRKNHLLASPCNEKTNSSIKQIDSLINTAMDGVKKLKFGDDSEIETKSATNSPTAIIRSKSASDFSQIVHNKEFPQFNSLKTNRHTLFSDISTSSSSSLSEMLERNTTSGRPKSVVINRRKSSFLSSNRLSSNVEDIVKSTLRVPSSRLSAAVNAFQSSPHQTAEITIGKSQSGEINPDSPAITSTTPESPISKKVISSAMKLLEEGAIDEHEYQQLIASDMFFHDEHSKEDDHFTISSVESAFGELWFSKKERILGDKYEYSRQKLATDNNNDGDDHFPTWDLRCFIIKTNDDLRQEMCCMQLMQLCKEIFEHYGLDSMLFLKPYRIVCTGNSTGVVEVLPNTISIDGLKKTKGFTTLNNYFKKTYGTSPEKLNRAKHNFAASLAAYSLFSYILLIKDRHNGNLLIDSEGHIIHIDFGFLLSIAPGGSFSLETAPFKLTEEMVELLGGLNSPLFGEFVTSFTKGFIALQASAENIVSAIQSLSINSSFPCFVGKQTNVIIDKLRSRFRTELSASDLVKHCLDLITNSYGNYGTRQYDSFQWYSNGIMP